MSVRRPIQVLPKVLADQIAAGEVIEGPTSVVKELVENALDAAATEISIHLKQGGLESILVQDNGYGMAKEDLPRCILRHATSKIESYKDILKLNSHGFRGEALAAMAAVARLKMTSGIEDQTDVAYSLEVDPLRGTKIVPTTYQKGTTVCVEHLFSWIPARKKFLRSSAAETTRCLHAMWPLLLMHPTVTFHVSTDDWEASKDYAAVPDIQTRFFQLFPMLTPKDVFQLRVVGKEVTISGFLSHPMATVGHRRQLFTAVNHRVVTLPPVLGVLKRVFAHMDGKRGYPWGFVHFRVSPAEVDFNVDPKKDSVRLTRESSIVQLLQGELNHLVDKGQVVLPAAGRLSWMKSMRLPAATNHPTATTPLTTSYAGTLLGQGALGTSTSVEPLGLKALPLEPQIASTLPNLPMIQPIETSIPWASLSIMGVVDQLIICATDHEAFYYFDQHALHERLTYEKYREQLTQGPPPQQALLVPERRLVDEVAFLALKQAEKDLLAAGFSLSFSQTAQGYEVVLEQVPVFLSQYPNLSNLLTWVEHTGGSLLLEAQSSREIFLADMACKHSVRRGDSLSMSEIKSLFAQAQKWLPDKTTCPHGRPFMMKLPFAEIYQTFYRKR